MVLITLVLCLCLRQYKLLLKATGLVVLVVAIGGVVAPGKLETSLGNMKDAVLYKGHKEEGILGSRQTPWKRQSPQSKNIRCLAQVMARAQPATIRGSTLADSPRAPRLCVNMAAVT